MYLPDMSITQTKLVGKGSSTNYNKRPRMSACDGTYKFGCILLRLRSGWPIFAQWNPQVKIRGLLKSNCYMCCVNRTTQHIEWNVNVRIGATHLLTSQFNKLLSYALTRSSVLYEAKYDWLNPIVQCFPSSLFLRFPGHDEPCKQ